MPLRLLLGTGYGSLRVRDPQSRVASPKQRCRAAPRTTRSCDRSLHLKQAAEGGPGEPLHRRYHAATNGHRPGYDPGTLRLLPGPSSKPTDTRVRPLRPIWGLLDSRRGRYRSLGVTLPGRPGYDPGPASSGPPIPPRPTGLPGATPGPASRCPRPFRMGADRVLQRGSSPSPSRHDGEGPPPLTRIAPAICIPHAVRCPLAGPTRRTSRPPVTVTSA